MEWQPCRCGWRWARGEEVHDQLRLWCAGAVTVVSKFDAAVQLPSFAGFNVACSSWVWQDYCISQNLMNNNKRARPALSIISRRRVRGLPSGRTYPSASHPDSSKTDLNTLGAGVKIRLGMRVAKRSLLLDIWSNGWTFDMSPSNGSKIKVDEERLRQGLVCMPGRKVR